MAQSIRTLSDNVAVKVGITKAYAYEFGKAFIESMREALVNGDEIVIQGFGSFSVKQLAARERRNPRTGEPIQCGVKARVKFKTSPILKAELPTE